MLTGNYNRTATPDEWQETPSTWETMSDNFVKQWGVLKNFDPTLSADERDLLNSHLQNLENRAGYGDQGFGQKAAGWAGAILGNIVNPVTAIGFGVGGVVAEGALSTTGMLVGRYAPAIVEKSAPVMSKTFGEAVGFHAPNWAAKATLTSVARSSIHGGITMGIGTLPQNIADRYDNKTHQLDFWGGVRASLHDGGIGLLLPAPAYLAATLWGRVFRAGAKIAGEVPGAPVAGSREAESLAIIDGAETAGHYTKAEAQWMRDYVNGNTTAEELRNRASTFLANSNHPIDGATKDVLLKVFPSDMIENLQAGIADSAAASHLSDSIKNLFPKEIANTAVDMLGEKPHMADGLQGVADFLASKVAAKKESLEYLNKVMRKVLPENLVDKNPIFQKKIYQLLKKGESYTGTVPVQVSKRLRQEQQLEKLEQTIKNYERKFQETNKDKFSKAAQRVKDKAENLRNNLTSLLNHKKEIEFLKNKLSKEGEPVENFIHSHHYGRLQDLATVRNSARHLLSDLHVRDAYNTQEAYSHLLRGAAKVMRNKVTNTASTENIFNYLKERAIPKEPLMAKVAKANLKEAEEKAQLKIESENHEDILKDLDQKLKDAPESVRQEYQSVRRKLEEFKSSTNVMSNLLKCLGGGA